MSKQASQTETAGVAPSQKQHGRPGRTNTSGYVGVSWNKGAGKWGAYIRRQGVRRYLGLFSTVEAARDAYLKADAELHVDEPERRSIILDQVRALYAEHGSKALASPFLKAAGVTRARLIGVGLNHAGLLNEIGLTEEYKRFRAAEFTYAGKVKPRLSWDLAKAEAGRLVEREGDLPTVQWCRLNGFSRLTNYIHKSGRSWEDLRAAIGLPPSVKFFGSRNGLRWRSRPEASFSNFLYARGVEHKRGERYADGYAQQSGRAYGRYDLHFKSKAGAWIDVEIWGDIPDAYSHGRYGKTRAFKEAWHAGVANFLGLQYQDCLSDARLAELLEPHIGVVEPFQFDKPQDRLIETAHWSDADELLETCRQMAAEMPDGIFPGDEWLRKRGRYADRPGEDYNTLAQRVTTWLGGTRNVRRLLGQSEASTTAWSPESVVQAWREFEALHGLSPSQLKSKTQRGSFPPGVVKEAQRIYEAAARAGVRDHARRGVSAKIKWTAERAVTEWREFHRVHGISPSQAMGAMQRRTLPREVSAQGARIYGAALKLGVVDEARSGGSAIKP